MQSQSYTRKHCQVRDDVQSLLLHIRFPQITHIFLCCLLFHSLALHSNFYDCCNLLGENFSHTYLNSHSFFFSRKCFLQCPLPRHSVWIHFPTLKRPLFISYQMHSFAAKTFSSFSVVIFMLDFNSMQMLPTSKTFNRKICHDVGFCVENIHICCCFRSHDHDLIPISGGYSISFVKIRSDHKRDE